MAEEKGEGKDAGADAKGETAPVIDWPAAIEQVGWSRAGARAGASAGAENDAACVVSRPNTSLTHNTPSVEMTRSS